MKGQNKPSFEQLVAILIFPSPEEQGKLLSAWNKATIKQRRQWFAWAEQRQRRGPGSTVAELLREVARKEVPTREAIMFANFEFNIRKEEDPEHGGHRYLLNEFWYQDYLRSGKPYPKGKQLHLSKEERRVASPPNPREIERVEVLEGDEVVSVGIADERAEPPMQMSAETFRLLSRPRSTEPRWVPRFRYRCDLSPYHEGSTEIPPRTFLQFQEHIRDALRTIAANPNAPLPSPPFVPAAEAKRQNSPWRSQLPQQGTYCHYMLQDLREVRQTDDRYRVKQCDCGNFFLQNTPKQRFCQPQCSGRSRIAKLRRSQ